MRLHLLELGLFSDGTPVSAALIQTGDGRNLLVDTGCPPLHEPWPEDDGEAAAHLAGCRRALLHDFGAADAEALLHGLGVRLPDRLAAMGLAARDVDAVLCTHLDTDHAGWHHLFGHAELWIQRRQYWWARSSADPRVAMNRRRWGDPALRYRLVDGDATVAPGVELIETSGHVPGHQSVLVRLPRTGPVLLAGDAVPVQADFRPDREAGRFDLDADAARASARKLLSLAERERAALVVFGAIAPLFAGPLKRYRAIPARSVARAMLEAALDEPPGSRTYEGAELFRLAG